MSAISMNREELMRICERLTAELHLAAEPIGIGFSDTRPDNISEFDQPLAKAATDGRSGRVPAGCVFWMKSAEGSFTTVAADHGNCSVGSFTHGLLSMEDITGNSDVAELLNSGWVNETDVMGIPHIGRKYSYITYGPISRGDFIPDVVLLRVNARQLMVISDAVGLKIEGKPQCHIVAVAKETGQVSASVGCALSRVRTGMSPTEMTCAIPISKFAETVSAIEKAAGIDGAVAKYAAADALRFAG